MTTLVKNNLISLVNILIGVISLPFPLFAQKELSFSTLFIYSDVTVKNNWSPPTAINYREYIDGSASGYGFQATYSFHPKFLLKDERLRLHAGLGYFVQRFNVFRPFSFDTPFEPIFYTDHYSYQGIQQTLGTSFTQPFRKKYAFKMGLTYLRLHSFQQKYKPTVINSSYGWITQVNSQRMHFADMLFMSAGLKRMISRRSFIFVDMIVPLYIRWRNDSIFNDNPATFSRPNFSVGSSLGITYRIGKTD